MVPDQSSGISETNLYCKMSEQVAKCHGGDSFFMLGSGGISNALNECGYYLRRAIKTKITNPPATPQQSSAAPSE